MSIQSARDFLEKLSKDGEFRKALAGCKTKADQLAFAQRAGFAFTAEEIDAARGELQDLDLSAVSAGGCLCGCDQDVTPPEQNWGCGP